MALAADHHTPISDLDDLLRYLIEELGYARGVAFYMMKERWAAGELLLEKQEYVADCKPYGDAVVIDAKFGDLELHRGQVRVVPRIKLWREVSYKIAEQCNIRALWPALSTPMAALPTTALPPPRKTNPPKKAKRETQHDRLINLMNEHQLPAGILPRDVRTVIESAYKTKHRVAVAPSRSAITRAYNEYEAALTGTTKPSD
jgi:hypothetical protein